MKFRDMQLDGLAALKFATRSAACGNTPTRTGFMLRIISAALMALAGVASAATLSNVALPKDSAGRQLLTGEADV